MKKLIRMIYYPFRDVVINARLIWAMVKRDFASRHKASLLGLLWTVVQPIFMITVYTITFCLLMQVRFGDSSSPITFVLYLFCGMLPWQAFSEGLTRSSTVIIDNSNFVKKIVFPTQILPINMMLSALITEGIAIVVMMIALLVFRHALPWTILLLPLLLIPQILLTLGLGWIFASLTVFIRDIANFLNLILTAWMFFTPIFYPEKALLDANLPAALKTAFLMNPMFTIVSGYRKIFIDGRMVDIRSLGILAGVSLVAFWVGYTWFYRTRKSFADVL